MTTPSDDIRRRVLAGEPLTSEQCAQDYGVSKSLLSTVLASFERDGHTFTRERLDNGSGGAYRYTLSTPAPTPGVEWGKGRGVRKLGNRGGKDVPREGNGSNRKVAANGTTVPAPTRAKVNGNGKGTDHPVPVLGKSLTVFLLALADDGRVNVGLRDEEGATWLTSVDGFSAR